MATSLSAVNKCFRALLGFKQVQTVPQRNKGGFHVRWKRKRPIKSWFDPKDKSWAKPILDQQQRKESEPPQEPSMLHMVYRIRGHFTRPYWEKDILKEFGIFEKSYNPVVLKNSPEVNEKLKVIQHLIRIKPVSFPYGLPKDESDYKHCYLRENGEFVVKQKLRSEEEAETDKSWSEVKVVEDQSETEDVWKMQVSTMRKECRNILDRYRLSEEYFREKYVYRHNEDGKEDRYKGNTNIGNRRQDWF